MDFTLFWLEKVLLVAGILSILTSMYMYGRRSSDWSGLVTMFFKRVQMNIAEYKWYRIGVALVLVAVVLKVALYTFFLV
ncbi:hypothetical protein [Vibrio maerlii]|uniref:hypothetical protein n=1 Tax=Vibrio maerlii TaxID=2231648 RepID=UPI000E3BC224|nr:hypothetical protein [Vibrio maerlii]